MLMFDTVHKRKSAIVTSVILTLLLLAIFNFGLRYLDPPLEYGVTINFGDSSFGKNQPNNTNNSTVVPNENKESVEEVKEDVVEEVNEEVVENELPEEVITQNNSETTVVEKKEESNNEEKPVENKEVEKPKPKPKKPSKETVNAFNNLLKNDANEKANNEGDDNVSGVKGKKDGDPNSTKYYGNKGSGGNSNYNLAGRNATSKPIQKPNCQEEGIVVVSIEVDRKGNVISATAGVKGSTNTADCLLKPAKEAALRTKWNADDKAPFKQKGTITYRFTLTQ